MFQDAVGSQPAYGKEVRGKTGKGSALSRPIAFRKAGGQDADGSRHVEASSGGVGEARSVGSSDKPCFQKRGSGAAGAARPPPPAKVVVAVARATPPAVSTDNAVQAKLRGQLTEERLALMAAMVVHTRTRAEAGAAGAAGAAPPTAKELHAAVGEARWKLPPTTMAAVKKAMSLLVAMQRAGMPPPTASGP